MLETKYGLKYSMPHTLVHIVDNSMYQGQLPTVVADDPSLYTSIVVSGAPMGVDNEIITVDRSDVLNVAYGMSNLTSSDILKYGQAVTYPSDLLAQGVPVKFLRVTPEDSTYAFSCLLVQWRWDPTDNKMHVRFKTSDNLGNDGLPVGQVLSSFKNTARLNAALVKGFKEDISDDTGTWKQRVFMTFIAAGRGKNYNKYRYAINITQQGRKPANARYLFSTIDGDTNAVIERFYASLINENNNTRIDAIENVNVQVGKRVKGSSVLIPTVNESAIHEIYKEYYDKLTEMDASQIYPDGTSDKWIKEVKATLNENTFDVIYGRYIYNGDSDVLLPYYQVDMFDLDIPQLDKNARLYVYLDKDDSIQRYISSPDVLNDTLKSKTVAVSDTTLTNYYVGDMFLTDTSTRTLSLITGINQYSGSVTSVKIQGCVIPAEDESSKESVENFAGYISIKGDVNKANVIATVQTDLINKSKIRFVVDTSKSTSSTTYYKPSFILVEIPSVINGRTGLNTFGIAKIAYKEKVATSTIVEIDDTASEFYTTPAEIFPIIALPSKSITNLATELPKFNPGASDAEKARMLNEDPAARFWQTPGATVIDTNGELSYTDTTTGESVDTTGEIFINTQGINSSTYNSIEGRIQISENQPFMVGKCPTQLTVNKDVVGSAYDVIIYQNAEGSEQPITWSIIGGSTISSDAPYTGYAPGDILEVRPNPDPEHPQDEYVAQFEIDAVEETAGGSQIITLKNSVTSTTESTTKIVPGVYPCKNITSRGNTEDPEYIKTTIPLTFDPPADFYTSPVETADEHIVYQYIDPDSGEYTDKQSSDKWNIYTSYRDAKQAAGPGVDEYFPYRSESAPSNWGDASTFYEVDEDPLVPDVPYKVVTFTGTGTTEDPYVPAYEPNKYYMKREGTGAPADVASELGYAWRTDGAWYEPDSVSQNPEGRKAIVFTGDGSAENPYLPVWDDTSYYVRSQKQWYLEHYRDSGNLRIVINSSDIEVNVTEDKLPDYIQRYIVSGTQGSIFRYNMDTSVVVPTNYYSNSYGLNPNSETGGIQVHSGYAGFFDDNISDIEFKWKYSELLVRAFKGELDGRILSPNRCPAKFLFDGAYNTIVGQTILSYMTYRTVDIINASTIYTDDEKEAILLDNSLISALPDVSKGYVDIDVKGAMYWLMEFRCYQGIPDDKRPIGPGSGLSLHLDSGITEGNNAIMVKNSFTKRFTNPNASWDIGGYTSSDDGITYTYTKQIVGNLFNHIKQYTVNKPYTGKYTNITADRYVSFFPDLGDTSWEEREELYKSGGNNWIQDINGNLQRQSQRTLYREGDTSDLIQESNMRTLSQLVYLLQNKINTYLLEYNDDGVLKTLKDDVDNMFSNWTGTLVEALDIQFERDINPLDGGEIVVCYCNVTFRGLILRVPIIVNVQRRSES